MVRKFDWHSGKSEFESHWVTHSFGLVLQLSKTLKYYNRIYGKSKTESKTEIC